tara:strand:- start:101 stop:334 length:234 start_codon:yes stop_codon:yes gene_type:complete
MTQPKYLQPEEASKFCKISGDTIVLMPQLENELSAYEINLEKIINPIDLVDWTVHLSRKSWMVLQRVRIFCTVVVSH